METEAKETYQAPTMLVLELKTESGILTTSSDQYEPTEW